VIQVTKETMNEKYLGLPVQVGRSKTGAFAYLKDRIWKRMQGWNENFFIMGREGDLDQGCCTSHPNICDGML
jgi:hypothetical protein